MSKSDHFLFYSTEISKEVLVLGSDEVAHITTVLRFGVGDEIKVTDGEGTIFECRIEKMKRDMALCSILTREIQTRATPEITLFVGVPDRDRMETLCEELPPLGVSKVIPVITQHCQKNWWGNRWTKSNERFQRKMIASIKQSHNPFFMKVEQPISFEEALEQMSETVLYCDEKGTKLSEIPSISEGTVSVVVGPPGGFTDEEKATLSEKATALALGPYRLRTELAAVTATSLVNQWRL